MGGVHLVLVCFFCASSIDEEGRQNFEDFEISPSQTKVGIQIYLEFQRLE
jgi:hypothetical protein